MRHVVDMPGVRSHSRTSPRRDIDDMSIGGLDDISLASQRHPTDMALPLPSTSHWHTPDILLSVSVTSWDCMVCDFNLVDSCNLADPMQTVTQTDRQTDRHTHTHTCAQPCAMRISLWLHKHQWQAKVHHDPWILAMWHYLHLANCQSLHPEGFPQA